jgi:hypothetical protein
MIENFVSFKYKNEAETCFDNGSPYKIFKNIKTVRIFLFIMAGKLPIFPNSFLQVKMEF